MNTPAATRMKYRNPIKVVLFSIATLGIYILYWLYATTTEMKHKGQKIPSVWWLLIPIPTSIVHILLTSLISLFLDEASGAYHLINFVLFPIIGILVVFGIVPLIMWWMWKYCTAVQTVTNGRLTRSSSFTAFCLLFIFGAGFLWPMIMQNYFNSEHGTH